MPKGYRPYLPDQALLLPPSLSQWLPEEHLAYLVSDVVDQLDLAPMHAEHAEHAEYGEYGEEWRGQPPYDPRMMTKLLVYGCQHAGIEYSDTLLGSALGIQLKNSRPKSLIREQQGIYGFD